MTCVGLDGVKGKIQEVRDFVDERVEALSRKQVSTDFRGWFTLDMYLHMHALRESQCVRYFPLRECQSCSVTVSCWRRQLCWSLVSQYVWLCAILHVGSKPHPVGGANFASDSGPILHVKQWPCVQDCLADSQEEMLQQLGDVQHDVKGVCP